MYLITHLRCANSRDYCFDLGGFCGSGSDHIAEDNYHGGWGRSATAIRPQTTMIRSLRQRRSPKPGGTPRHWPGLPGSSSWVHRIGIGSGRSLSAWVFELSLRSARPVIGRWPSCHRCRSCTRPTTNHGLPCCCLRGVLAGALWVRCLMCF